MSGSQPIRICTTCRRPLAEDENKSLLNPSQIYYVFRLTTSNWGNGPIMDERENIIGTVRQVVEKTSGLRVFDFDGTPLLFIRKKNLRAKYNLFDVNDNQIAWIRPNAAIGAIEFSSSDLSVVFVNEWLFNSTSYYRLRYYQRPKGKEI